MKIETKRLDIYPLNVKELEMLVYDLPALEHSLMVSYQAEPMDGWFLEIVRGQIESTKEDSIHYYWHTFWLIIRKKDRVVVGSCDFKDAPDEKGNVEIGYGLGDGFRGMGYMTEAVKGMCTWAIRQQGVAHVIAETEPEGVKSQAVLKRCGFKPWFKDDTTWWIRV